MVIINRLLLAVTSLLVLTLIVYGIIGRFSV
jgi:hypothetical protein